MADIVPLGCYSNLLRISALIFPLDFNEFLSVRYMFQLRCKVAHFSRKTCGMRYLIIVHPNE